jgi:CO/xanthine dehydrogenase FAD-binding subunit
LACDAEVVVASAARGERTVPAEQFFVGFLTTAIDADELLTAVRVPDVAANTGTSFVEVTRRHGDFAIVGAATMVKIDGDRIVDVRIVLTGVTDTPLRCLAAESALCGASPSVEAFRAAAAAATDGLHPPSDLHGSASYRAHVSRVVVRRALTNAASRSGASH